MLGVVVLGFGLTLQGAMLHGTAGILVLNVSLRVTGDGGKGTPGDSIGFDLDLSLSDDARVDSHAVEPVLVGSDAVVGEVGSEDWDEGAADVVTEGRADCTGAEHMNPIT